jgi:hypothetical protein
MNLADLTFWALVGLASPSDDRLVPVADAVAAVSADAPVFAGDAGDAATAFALAAIGRHESGLRESVRCCRLRGDQGRSIGIFQVMRGELGWGGHAAEDICASDLLQARLARDVLAYHRDRCAACGPAYLFQAYASGDGGKESDAAKDTQALFERTTRKAGVRVSGGTASWQ